MEVFWVAALLALVLPLFGWSGVLYLEARRIPPNAMEIFVIGKQWMWELQHPEGRWENNELHLPVGRPVVLTMTSRDVIHSFFIPAFRLKQDVVPGTYTQLAFTPTRTGRFALFCAEYCGTLHSAMTGTVTVMSQAEYDAWLRADPTRRTPAEVGARLFTEKGCASCHDPDAPLPAPRLAGIYGREVWVRGPRPGDRPTRLRVDARYLRESMLFPELRIRIGCQR